MVSELSNHQLEKFIRSCAENSFNVAFTKHAEGRMRRRYVTRPMVLETLRCGCIVRPPAVDGPGLKCRMERMVSGANVTVVVYVEYPDPNLTVITVIEIGD